LSAPRLLISSGESSGDLYGAELVRELRLTLPDLVVSGLGGDRLAEQGATLHAHVRELAIVGLLEVVRHLGRIRRVFHRVLAAVDEARPDVAVLIDYPDFNLRLALELKRRGIPIVYYVSPQLWAWRGGRMRTVRETVARMLVIFPFEEELYRSAGVPVSFVGHPLVDLVRPAADPGSFLRKHGLDPARPLIAVLPGSRPQEIAYNLPPLAAALRLLAQARPDLQFVAAVAPALDAAPFEAALAGLPARIVKAETQQAVGAAALALVASGTATVETALLGTPMVVVYRISRVTYALGRPLVNVPHFAMVNLIAGSRIVPELMQSAFTPEAVCREALHLLDPMRAAEARAALAGVRVKLGDAGASARAAAAVREFIPQQKR
jgi:lipid-A-disaccharide synthase